MILWIKSTQCENVCLLGYVFVAVQAVFLPYFPPKLSHIWNLNFPVMSCTVKPCGLWKKNKIDPLGSRHDVVNGHPLRDTSTPRILQCLWTRPTAWGVISRCRSASLRLKPQFQCETPSRTSLRRQPREANALLRAQGDRGCLIRKWCRMPSDCSVGLCFHSTGQWATRLPLSEPPN